MIFEIRKNYIENLSYIYKLLDTKFLKSGISLEVTLRYQIGFDCAQPDITYKYYHKTSVRVVFEIRKNYIENLSYIYKLLDTKFLKNGISLEVTLRYQIGFDCAQPDITYKYYHKTSVRVVFKVRKNYIENLVSTNKLLDTKFLKKQNFTRSDVIVLKWFRLRST